MGTRLALFMAIILGVVCALAVRMWMQEEKEKIKHENKPIHILVARGPIKKGEALTEKNTGLDLINRKFSVAGMIPYQDYRLHLGKIVTQALSSGNPILTSMLTRNPLGGSTQKSFIAPGMRAVTIRVDQEKAVGYLVRPGSYVDVFATFQVRTRAARGRTAAGSSAAAGERVNKTICLMEAVKVLAVDNKAIDTVRRRRSTGAYRTITLEVPPADAGRLINAQVEGRIRLVLRAPQDQKRVLKSIGEFRWQELSGNR